MRNRTFWLLFVMTVAVTVAVLGVMMEGKSRNVAVANVDGSTAEFIQPLGLDPSTALDFSIQVTNGETDPQREWLSAFELTVPAGYVVNSAQDPAANHPEVGNTWSHTVTTDTIRWEATGNTSNPPWGDVANGESIVFDFNATTDPAPTDGFPWTVIGDTYGEEPHTITGTAFVGGGGDDDDDDDAADDDDDAADDDDDFTDDDTGDDDAGDDDDDDDDDDGCGCMIA